MNGLEIQYLLGLWFALNTVSFEAGRVNVNLAQVVIGLVLVLLAIFGLTPLK